MEQQEKKLDSQNIPQHLTPKTMDSQYKTLFEQVSAAAFLCTYDGQILQANHKSCDLFGYTWDEMHHLSIRNLLHTDFDWQQCKEDIAARGGITLETEAQQKSGNFIPTEISISLFKDNDQLYTFILIFDISKRKNAEKQLRESEKKYHGLFEYTTDGILVLDQRGQILDINTKLCNILDYSKDELINQNLFSMNLLTAESLPAVIEQFEQLLIEKTAKPYITHVKKKNKTILDVEITSFFLVKKENEIDNFVLIVRDITSRMTTAQRDHTEHELFQTLMEYIPDSIYFKDQHHRFILVNRAKAIHANVSPEEMIGKTDFDFMPKELAEKSRDDDNKVLTTGQPIINHIEKIIRTDGQVDYISVIKIPRFDADGNIIGTIGISRNINELQLESQTTTFERIIAQTLINTYSESISIKDIYHRFIMVNNATAQHFNTTPQAMLGKTDFDFLPYERAQQAKNEEDIILTTGKPLYKKTEKIEKITSSNQNNTSLTITKLPLYNPNHTIIGILCLSTESYEPPQAQS